MISAFQLLVIYIAAIAIFGVRISGSVPGFLLVAVMFCLLNAAFGLMLATLDAVLARRAASPSW